MGHFAKVLNGKVINVIVAEPEFFETFIDSSPGKWIQTSYNTNAGIHYTNGQPSEDQSKALRKNFAGIGDEYNEELDAFISPKPFASWILNTDKGCYDPPVPYPTDGNEYSWNETEQNWDILP